jgi:hypothetical protein
MTILSRRFTGVAGLAAALAIASPAAAAQPYPYSGQNTGVVGAIVNAVTGNGYNQYPQGGYGYGQYPQGNYGYGETNQRAAVGICAAAAEQRISATYRGQPGTGYNNGYQLGYANGQIGRVLGITNVERRSNGSLKVSGLASSGRGHGYNGQGYNGQGYNGQGYNNQGYNNGYNGQNAYTNPAADLRFTCKVNARGQVTDVNINRNQVAYRGY